MRHLIALVGENGAGKDTFTLFFKAAVAPVSVSRVRFSDVLYETLELWGIEPTRANLQNMAIIMDKQYGKGSLTKATRSRIESQQSDIVVVEGIRWKQDVPMIKSFTPIKSGFDSTIVYVTAQPEVRFERMRKRGDKVGETKITREQFDREEKALTELEIPEIGAASDYKIENNGSLDEFRQKTEELVKRYASW